VIGDSVQIVGHLYKDSSTTYNRFGLWVDPAYGDTTPDVLASVNTSLTSVDRLGFRTANLDSGANADSMLIDDLTVATQLADVATPEPATLAIWGLGLGIAGLVKLRRNRLAA
jgi:hypothetical protein